MFELFTQRFESNNSVLRPPSFDLIRRIYYREIEKIVHYYNDRVFTIKSDHILCRILNTVSVPLSYDLDRYTQAAYARSPYISKHFNFTSDIHYGKFFDGIFYGAGCTELLLMDDSYFNPYESLVKWKKLQAVKVLEHPVSDLGLNLPDGERNSSAKGLVVMSVNIPLLLIQFRGFMTEQIARMDRAEISQLDISHFVHMYVLPGMLQSHAEIVILNRLKNLYYGAPMSETLQKHPFMVVDYSRRLDDVLKDCLDNISSRQMLYNTMMKNIPTIFHQDMQEFLLMPDIARTRQAWWALLLARLSTMAFLFDVGSNKARAVNSNLLARMRIDARMLDRENILVSQLPEDLFYEVQEMIDKLRTQS